MTPLINSILYDDLVSIYMLTKVSVFKELFHCKLICQINYYSGKETLVQRFAFICV